MKSVQDKREEDRVRRALARRGFLLRRNRCRTPGVHGYGGYMVVNAEHNAIVAGAHPWPYSLTLEEAAEWLEDD